MPTSSSAQPMMAFSSPLLSSVDRLLRGFDSRFGAASFLSTLNRFESFSDRLLSRRLSSLGLPVQASGFAPRELPPVPMLEHAESWASSPSAAVVRAGTRSPAVAAPKPASSRVASVGMPLVPPALASASAAAVPSASATLAPALSSNPVAGSQAVSQALTPTLARDSYASESLAAPSQRPDIAAPVAPLNRGVAPSERARSIMPELSDVASSADAASANAASVGMLGSDEPRGLDLVLRSASYPSVQRPPSPEILKLSALARSFMHLGWSDARLGMGSSDPAVAMLTGAGALPFPRGASATEPGALQSARIASGSALAQTMVSPDAVAPRAAQASAATNRTAQTLARPSAAQTEIAHRQESTSAPSQPAALGAPFALAAPLPGSAVTAPALDASVSAGSVPTVASSTATSVDTVAAASSDGTAITGSVASMAPRAVAERAVTSPRRTVIAEMAELLGPWSPGLSPSMWLGETVSRERSAASNERTQVQHAAREQLKPLTAPGRISAQVEQFAARMGMATGAPLPSADHPHFAAEWSQAPGLSSSVQRLLKMQAQSDSAAIERPSPALPMLAAPSFERTSDRPSVSNRSGGSASDRAASKPEKLGDVRAALPLLALQVADSAGADSRISTLDRQERLATSPLVSSSSVDRRADAASLTVEREAAASSSARPSFVSNPAIRPWLKMGGVATLAELFAAGVGLSSGGAQRAAESAGLSISASVLPSWLIGPARFKQSDTDAAASKAAPSLSYLSSEFNRSADAVRDAQAVSPSLRREPMTRDAARTAKSDAPSFIRPLSDEAASEARTGSFVPSETRTLSDAPSASIDVSRPVTSPSEPLARMWGQVGGLAASTEAFARSHGIARIEELVGADPAAVAAPSQFVPLAGGQVLVSSMSRRADRAIRDSGSSPASVMIDQAAVSPSSVGSGSSSSFASPSLAPPSTWQRPGGMALRSELLAAQMTTAMPWLQPSVAKQWRNAPGLPSSMAQLLASTDSQDVLPRWAMGPQGLVFVAGPQPERTVRADAGSIRRGAEPQARGAASSEGAETSGRALARPLLASQNQLAPSVLGRLSDPTSLSGSSPALFTPGREDSVAASSQDGTGLRALLGSVAEDLPWLRVGGMGALAELFAASVGVGTGAAQSMAQSLGVSSGRSLTPDWLLSLAARSGSPEQASRLAALLPSLILPSVANRSDAQTQSMTRQAAQGSGASPTASMGTAFRETSSAARPSLGSLLTGGLAASMESFARQFGMERVAGPSEPTTQADAHTESAGRWLSVAGGMVFLPKDQPAQPAQPSTGPHATRASSAALSPSMSIGQLGATALRSEIFSALLGPQRTLGDLVSRSSSQALPGWDDFSSLLTSLPKSDATMEPSLPRWGLGGTGGLMFVGAPSAKYERTATSHRPEQASSLRSLFAPKQDASSSSLPGAVATRALSMADRSASMVQPAQHIASPLLSLVSGPTEWNRARRGVSDVEQAYTQRLVTSFPRQAQPDGSEPTPTSLWPKAMLTQVQRLEKVVSMLPSEWQPSLKVVAALRQSGVAQTPLWKELPKALNTVKPYETADDGESASMDSAQISASALRSPALSLVDRLERSAPTAATPRASTVQTEASKQQSVERAMTEAVASLIKSGGQAAASARLLDAIRTHATNQPTRSDDRLNLSDLTMIALSMGQNRIAASSPDHPKDRLEPNVGNALRMKQSKHVEDDKNSYRKAVSEHAEQVLKHMKDQLDKQKMRGQF